MPLYEYRCNACQREFEIQQKMADPDLVTCEVCGEDKLEKLISWSAFRLGGMGDASWTKQLNGKMTAEQQRDVARSLVDKGAPPKRPEKPAADAAKPAPAEAAAPAATASTASTSGASASDAPAAEAPADASTPSPPSDGGKE